MKKGFTVLEVMVAIGIFALVMSVGLVYDFSSYKRDTFHAEEAVIVSALQTARSRSMTNLYQNVHGICYIAPNYVIFRGRATCTPTASTDERIPANATIGSASNFSTTFPTIIFTQLSGASGGGTITMTDGVKTATITINNEGTIIW